MLDKDAKGNSLAAAVWIGQVNDPVADEIGYYLRDLLTTNIRGIEAILQGRYPKATVKQIIYGFGGNVEDYPAITVVKPRWSWTWLAFPFSKRYTYSATIACWVLHTTEQTEISYATRFAEACMEILSLPAYNKVTLPSGRKLFNVLVQSGEADETYRDDNKFEALSSLVWSAQAQLQQGRNYNLPMGNP
jgi:hypothetical protein